MRLREPAVTGHWPAVSRRHDGTWAVHCSSCSARAGDYVYGGCHPDDWPPQVLADPAEVRAAVYAELFGTPGQLADRKAEPGRPDDPAEVCERVAPRHHERQVRAKVEQEIRAIAPADRNPAGYSTTVAAAMEIARGGPDA
jgi:hypothetical protein